MRRGKSKRRFNGRFFLSGRVTALTQALGLRACMAQLLCPKLVQVSAGIATTERSGHSPGFSYSYKITQPSE